MQKSFKDVKPTLFLVSTPIGNLKDITYRAVEILSNVSYILAEDTRTSSILLNHYQIKKPLISYHEYNKLEKEDFILKLLNENNDIALISDAGTPGISDPGYEIILKVIEHGFHIVSIPGASAILAALITSGLIIQPFTFIGFLPKKKSLLTKTILDYKDRSETLVIYESPNRILETIEILYELLGNRKISIARELTKTFETIIRTTLLEAKSIEHNKKGEYVLIIEGKQMEIDLSISINDHVKNLIKKGLTEKEAIKLCAKQRNIQKNEVYKVFKID